MDTAAHWNHQDKTAVKPLPMEETTTKSNKYPKRLSTERKLAATVLMRPNYNKAQAAATLDCPRCNSPNTKFCYYNNYSLSQPRHFCKTCRRYWTQGGSLRNVPVGGASRKNKKPPPQILLHQNPNSVLGNLGHDDQLILQDPSGESENPLDGSSSHHDNPSLIVSDHLGLLNSFITIPPIAADHPSTLAVNNCSSGLGAFPCLDYLCQLDGLERRNTCGSFLQEKHPFQFQNGWRQVISNTSLDQEDQQDRDKNDDSTAGYWNESAIGDGGSW